MNVARTFSLMRMDELKRSFLQGLRPVSRFERTK
jgi:hypothetical protein